MVKPTSQNPIIDSEPAEQTASPQINPFDLTIGPPFALAQGCELLPRDDEAGIPGTYAAIRCACGATWRANVLSDDDKTCPQCGAAFTHIFLVCPTTERGMLAAVVEEILLAHGLLPEQDDDDQDDDDQDDDDQDDDDDDEHAEDNEGSAGRDEDDTDDPR
jgi:hypothetical protein